MLFQEIRMGSGKCHEFPRPSGQLSREIFRATDSSSFDEMNEDVFQMNPLLARSF